MMQLGMGEFSVMEKNLSRTLSRSSILTSELATFPMGKIFERGLRALHLQRNCLKTAKMDRGNQNKNSKLLKKIIPDFYQKFYIEIFSPSFSMGENMRGRHLWVVTARIHLDIK